MEDQKIIPISSLRSSVELQEEFTQLLTAHHRDLLIYARAIVYDADQARDLVQETCLAAWTQFFKFDPAQADFGTWARGILRNKTRDWAKSKKGGQRPEVSLDDAHLDYLDQSFSHNEQEGTFENLQSCLKKLPPELGAPIRLTYYEGHSGEEASTTLDIAYATFRKRLSRARQALLKCMTK